MKIWIDAGHGGNDPGAVSDGIQEKTLTLDIDNRLAKIMLRQGWEVLRTRTSDTTVDSNTRAARIKSSGAKYCISSHINAGGGDGAETIHSIYNDGRLAKEILSELGKLGINTRRAYTRKNSSGGDYYFMHRLTGSVTTIITEYVFLDNADNRQWILNATNRERCAEAVVKAICNVEGLKYKEEKTPNPPIYTGNSIVDYLISINVNSSFNNRKRLAAQHGIKNYRGTASQNLELLDKLRNNEKPQVSKPKGDMKTESIVDYLKSINVDSSFSNRKKLAEQHGISNYTGTAKQNTELLRKLRG